MMKSLTLDCFYERLIECLKYNFTGISLALPTSSAAHNWFSCLILFQFSYKLLTIYLYSAKVTHAFGTPSSVYVTSLCYQRNSYNATERYNVNNVFVGN